MKEKSFQDKTLFLEPGNRYNIKIIKFLHLDGDQDYFVGIDMNGLKHLIPSDYYLNYGISKGQTIYCRLDKINCLGRFFFEPEHPVYKPGLNYDFDLIGFNKYQTQANYHLYTAIVVDVFGNKWHTMKFRTKSFPPDNLTCLRCRVTSIKKARLSLEVADRQIDIIQKLKKI